MPSSSSLKNSTVQNNLHCDKLYVTSKVEGDVMSISGDSIAIGQYAGNSGQLQYSVAIGVSAGNRGQ